MIGLIEMIRQTVRSELWVSSNWRPVPRKQLGNEEDWTYPLSRRYYQLLDACPLRIPHDKQHSEQHADKA